MRPVTLLSLCWVMAQTTSQKALNEAVEVAFHVEGWKALGAQRVVALLTQEPAIQDVLVCEEQSYFIARLRETQTADLVPRLIRRLEENGLRAYYKEGATSEALVQNCPQLIKALLERR